MCKTKEMIAEIFVTKFPEKKMALTKHYQDFNELLGHVFFGEQISFPLIRLLQNEEHEERIKKYCMFIEEMWKMGNDSVKNIVKVSVLEPMTDNPVVWKRFGTFLSKEFREMINTEIVPEFRTWTKVSMLSDTEERGDYGEYNTAGI